MGFSTEIICANDWLGFEADWRAQSDQADEPFEDDASSSFSVLKGIGCGLIPQVSPLNRSGVAAFKSHEDGHFYAACMFNHAHLPGDSGPTMRVRHLIVSPLLDYGIADKAVYADVLISALTGIVQLSETTYVANEIKFHLRSPGDYDFFRAFGSALTGQKLFASVRIAGAWLYITKA